MDEAMVRVLNGLTREFDGLPMSTIIRAVTDCASRSGNDPALIERRAREDLRHATSSNPR